MLKQRLEELKEKERKFEERIQIHKENMHKEVELKKRYHSFQSQRMEQRRKLLGEEKEKEKSLSIKRLHEKDKHTEQVLKHRNEEYKILAEFESLKRDKRLNEAKRLQKVREYQKVKAFERIQAERSKSEIIQEQRKKILNCKIEENEKVKFIKEQLKEKIKAAQGHGTDDLEELMENPYKDFNPVMNKSMQEMVNKLSIDDPKRPRRSLKKKRGNSPAKKRKSPPKKSKSKKKKAK
mmetsp:Transcript_19105/g.18741  ORF Transcript_19105/g.18741 Transcript_19105/m.18741 type:complete len:237 (+) Transcript_19105:1082-1792(+)